MADTAYVGQAVTFHSCAQDANTYIWNFGDGTTATSATATHTYSVAGTYTVSFTTLNDAGTGNTKTFTLTVTYHGPATCIGQVPDSVYIGQAINFSSCTQDATSYLWNFGDGSSATTANASHTYTTVGTYAGSFTPTNANGPGATKNFIIVATINGGSWTFNDTTYKTVTCYSNYQSLNANSSNGSNYSTYGTLQCNFYSSLPATSGTYTVVYGSNLYNSSQVSIYLTTNGGSYEYYSTGTGGQTVQVTVANGKVSISGSGIPMENYYGSPTTSPLSFTITQTQ